MTTTNGVSPQVVVMGGLAAVVAVLFGYGCFVSWPSLALGYWGVLALFVYTQVKSWCEEDQSIAAFLSMEQKQHEKKLKNLKKKAVVPTTGETPTTTALTSKRSESISKKSRTKKVAEPEPVVEEVVADVTEEEVEEIVEEMTVEIVEDEVKEKKKKARKPKIQNRKIPNQKFDSDTIEALNLIERFEDGQEEFKVVPSVEQKKQMRAERARQEEEQRKREEEEQERLAQFSKAQKELRKVETAAAKAEIRAREASAQAERALQELENLTPKNKQSQNNATFHQAEQKQQKQQKPQLVPAKVAAKAAPRVVPPKIKAKAVQPKPVKEEPKTDDKKKVPPPGVSVWEVRAQEKAEAEMVQYIAKSEEDEAVCPDYASFGVCPRGRACTWLHQNPDMDSSKQNGKETILYKRGMLTEQEDQVIWSRANMPNGDDFDEGFEKAQNMDLDTQKTPLAPGALPFLPWAVREEFSTQFTSLNLGF